MAEWAGFSDEDLRRLRQDGDVGTGATKKTRKPGQRPAPKSLPQVNRSKVSPRQKLSLGNTAHDNVIPLSADQRLFQPPPVSAQGTKPPDRTQQKSCENTTDNVAENDCVTSRDSQNVDSNSMPCSTSDSIEHKSSTMGQSSTLVTKNELDEDAGINRELGNLKQFQAQQKLIEEQNKKKRELLTSAIQQRQRQAKAETSRLLKIQKELNQLDVMLTVDVSIIRDRIEEVSRDYLEAQKRYDRAEAEFIEAKVLLHKTANLKEELTEHLYTIIHQNELRKAKKLHDLMEKLAMEEEEEAEMELSKLPPLTVINPIHVAPKSPVKQSPTKDKELSDLSKQSVSKDQLTAVTQKPQSEGSQSASLSPSQNGMEEEQPTLGDTHTGTESESKVQKEPKDTAEPSCGNAETDIRKTSQAETESTLTESVAEDKRGSCASGNQSQNKETES